MISNLLFSAPPTFVGNYQSVAWSLADEFTIAAGYNMTHILHAHVGFSQDYYKP